MYLSVQNRSVHGRMAGAYQTVNASSSVSSADPHQLIQLLFDALHDTLLKAVGAMQRGDIAAKGESLSKAVRLIDEGLKAGLVYGSGNAQADALAKQLGELYGYASIQLTLANLRNDVQLIQQVQQALMPVATAWSQIRPVVGKGHAGQ